MKEQPEVRIPDRLFFRIGDVAELAGVKPYVLRFWETEFPFIAPEKSTTGQRVYRRSHVETILMIKHLLYSERYSIEGAKKRLRDLRSEGELRSYKEQTVRPARDTEREDRLKEISALAKELSSLGQTRLTSLFGY